MKQEKQHKLMKWTIISMTVVIVGLIPAVVVLAVNGSIANNRQPYCPRNNDQTHIPRYDGRTWSANYRLDFPNLYPPLTSSPDSACQRAWNTLTYVNCHEKIWNRAWDDGKRTLFDPELTFYVGPICTSSCIDRLQQAYQLVSSKCTKADRFVMKGYVGTFTADPGLEDGPVAALETIVRRIGHTCRQSPALGRGYYYGRPYCASKVYDDWFIIDGMNPGNLEGLDIFETLTANRTERRNKYPYYWSPNSNDCDNAYRQNYYSSRPTNVGPGVGETECGWCLLNWFDRKLLGWKKDAVFDPKNSSAVDLPDYIRRIRRLGARCETEDWNAIYQKAIEHYVGSGQLPKDWDNQTK